MNAYWKDYQGNDEGFWSHEWGKHGTCISSLQTSCYTDYVPKEEFVAYFQLSISSKASLPTRFVRYLCWSCKNFANYAPNSSSRLLEFSLLLISHILLLQSILLFETALRNPRGVNAFIQCKKWALAEIWYFYNIQGSVQSGTFFRHESRYVCNIAYYILLEASGFLRTNLFSISLDKSSCPSTGIKYLAKGTSPGGGVLGPDLFWFMLNIDIL